MMKTANTLVLESPPPLAVAVGYFDGVHLGHQAVIQEAMKTKAQGLSCCVLSFSIDESRPVLKQNIQFLQSPSLKAGAMKELGVDWFLTPDFSLFKQLTPEQFALDVLYRGLNARLICCGYDYHFGKDAAAGPLELSQLLSPFGVSVLQVGAVIDDGIPVSSTRIREYLKSGDMT